MDSNIYFVRRLGSAKALGLVIGLIGFFLVPVFWPGQSMWLRVGILLWYATFGAMIGLMGIFDHHPMLKFRMPFWFRGPLFGAWFNLVLAFLMYDKLAMLFQQFDGALAGIKSPFWIVLEGAVLGLAIDAVVTRFAGEGIPGRERVSP